MKKNYFIWIIIFAIGSFVMSSYAQAPPVMWSRCYGGSSMDHGSDVVETADSGFVMAGYTASNDLDVSGNNGMEDFWIIKTDNIGNLQWQKCLGGSDIDEAGSIQQTSDGGFVVAGLTGSNDSDVTGFHGGYDVWVVKLDQAGNMQWQKTLGGSDYEGVNSGYELKTLVEQTSDGGYAIATTTASNDYDVSGNHGDKDYWLVKLDSNGNFLWQKCYGGSATENLMDMRTTQDGGCILAGWSNSMDGDLLGYNSNFSTSFIVKTDSMGAIDWITTYYCIDTLSNCNGQMMAASIMQTPGGGYIAAGTIYYYGYVYYYITNAISSNGVVGGHFQYASQSSTWRNFCYSIQPTTDNGFILSGQIDDTDDDIFIYKSGSSGVWTFEWDTLSPEYQTAATAIECSDGGFIIGGTSNADVSCSPNYDPWSFRLIKLGGVLSVKEENVFDNFSCHLEDQILKLKFNSERVSDLHFALYDLTGRIISSSDFRSQTGMNIKNMEVGRIANGVYIASLICENGMQSFKVVKDD